jgi:methionine biosynthesis protein MetW
MTKLRADLAIIADWVTKDAHILDLGCGDGVLLQHLAKHKNVTGYGLEIDMDNIRACINNDVSVIQSDLNNGLTGILDNTFDFVVMSQSLQAMYFPDKLLLEMLRIGKQGIVSFPNMGHWHSRVQLALGGNMPVTKAIPHQWYNTPNIHLCTIKDFKNLCEEQNINVNRNAVVDRDHVGHLTMRMFPNLLAESALFQFESK